MSKKKKDQFPFRILAYWLKLYQGDEYCHTCGKRAKYHAECYMDFALSQSLLQQGKSQKEATDTIWNQAIIEQQQGEHTHYITTYHCSHCAARLIAVANGESVAMLSIMMLELSAGQSSAIVGYEVTSFEDEGVPFSAFVPAQQTVEELAPLLRREGITIHMKE